MMNSPHNHQSTADPNLRGLIAEKEADVNRRTLNTICLVALAAHTATAQNRVGNIVTGRAKIQLLYRYDGSTLSPRPDRVVLQDFPTEGEVVLEKSRFHHHHLLHHESNEDASPEELMQHVRDTFAKTVIERLEKDNVQTERVLDASMKNEPELIIRGEFISVNQGNARKRIMIGFGRGASDIKTHVVLSLVANGRCTVLLDFNVNSQSGKEPGALASTSGVGIAAGTVVGTLGDERSATVEADAARTGKLVVEQTLSVMTAENWMSKDQGSSQM
jgi:hypothetical protein